MTVDGLGDEVVMEHLKSMLAFIRKRYRMIIFFSVLMNSLHISIFAFPFTLLIPLIYLYLVSKMMRYYRESQDPPLKHHTYVFKTWNGFLRDSVLMLVIYVVALLPAVLTFLVLERLAIRPDVFAFTEQWLGDMEFLNALFVPVFPFVIVISIFSFVPYVIVDASDKASVTFILQKALRMIRGEYVKVLLIRVVTSMRYLGALLIITIPISAFGADAEFFMVNVVLFATTFLVFVPLYHGMMVMVYEKAKAKELDAQSHQAHAQAID